MDLAGLIALAIHDSKCRALTLLLVVRGVWALCEGLDGKLRAAASPVAITLDTALCV